jgi:hypothetical protein
VPSSTDLTRNLSLHVGGGDTVGLARSVREVLSPSPTPSAPFRALQRLAMKGGRLDWEQRWLKPLVDARRAVLGDAAAGPPRFLVRVDEFPYYTSFDQPQDLEMSRRFHDVMASAGLPHLMSVVPQLTHAPLDSGAGGGRPLGDEEIELLGQMRRDGVTFAQHGTSHRTRFDGPRRRSELCGLAPAEADQLLESGLRLLIDAGLEAPRAFVPPFNRFDAVQYPMLAERFALVCGGPESVPLMGFHGGPLWRDGAVYLPCYAPFYADARTILPAAERMIDLAPGTWIPIVLHTSWEQADDFRSLQRLAERIAPFATSWDDFLADIDRSALAASPAGVRGS